MFMQYPIFPDELAIAIDWLTSHTNITSRNATVAGDMKGFVAGDRWVQIQTTGGVETIPYRLNSPRIDINAYAESRQAAKDLCAATLAALKELQNHVTVDAVVTKVETGFGPADLTDPVNNQYRFVADATVHIRPI